MNTMSRSLVLRLVSAVILSGHLPEIRAKEYLLSQTRVTVRQSQYDLAKYDLTKPCHIIHYVMEMVLTFQLICLGLHLIEF